MRSTPLLIVLLLVLASCAGGAATELEPDAVVFRAESNGGCAQLGPNCVRVDVYGDGSVKAYRLGVDQQTPVDTGTIDRNLVIALHSEVSSADLTALHRRLPPGECRGCVDGIDTSMSFPFSVGDKTVMPLLFSSVEVELDPSEPLFDIAWSVYRAAEAAVDVPVVAR